MNEPVAIGRATAALAINMNAILMATHGTPEHKTGHERSPAKWSTQSKRQSCC
jgi:hypothetical protein